MKQIDINISKIKKDAIIPSKRKEDGGFDIYACVEDNKIIIPANSTKAIPTGIAVAFSQDYILILKERSSLGSKGIGLRAGVIDSGYRGEILVCLTNTNSFDVTFEKNITKEQEKEFYQTHTLSLDRAIVQGTFIENYDVLFKEIPYEDLKAISSQRGEGGFGSSGK